MRSPPSIHLLPHHPPLLHLTVISIDDDYSFSNSLMLRRRRYAAAAFTLTALL